MPRLPALTPTDLSDPQRVVWNRVTEGPRGAAGTLLDESGGLVGPFNAWLHSPDIGLATADLGEAVRFRSALGQRHLELAIVVVSCHWRCNFELWAHGPRAVASGVPEAVVDALVDGTEPDHADPGDALIVEMTRELLGTGRLSDRTFDAAVGLLGTAGVVDLVTTVGYYSLVALSLNAFEVPVPGSAPPRWPA